MAWDTDRFYLIRDGIDSEHNYFIAKGRLLEERGSLYDWPLHMAGKSSVDLDQFEPVFREALERWHKGRYDKNILDVSFHLARKDKERAARFNAFIAEKVPGVPGELLILNGAQLCELGEEFDRLEAAR